MNNKGFALSGMLYTILAIFVLLVVGLLTIFNSRKTILDKLKKKVLDETSNIYEIYNFKTEGEYEINITKTGYYEIEIANSRFYHPASGANVAGYTNGIVFTGKIYLEKDTKLYANVTPYINLNSTGSIVKGDSLFYTTKGMTDIYYYIGETKENLIATGIERKTQSINPTQYLYSSSIKQGAYYDAQFENVKTEKTNKTNLGWVKVTYIPEVRQNADLNKVKYIKDCITESTNPNYSLSTGLNLEGCYPDPERYVKFTAVNETYPTIKTTQTMKTSQCIETNTAYECSNQEIVDVLRYPEHYVVECQFPSGRCTRSSGKRFFVSVPKTSAVNPTMVCKKKYFTEIEALVDSVNMIDAGKITGDINPGEESKLVDGDLNSKVEAETFDSNGKSCITAELDNIYNLDSITVWHNTDNRKYAGRTLSVSSDGTNYRVIDNYEKPETINGLTVKANEISKVKKIGNVYVPIKKHTDGSVWMRIYHHNNLYGTIFWDSREQVTFSDGYDGIYKKSILYYMKENNNNLKFNGKYEFMLEYPDDFPGKYGRWEQTSNFTTKPIISGYKGLGFNFESPLGTIKRAGFGGLVYTRTSITSLAASDSTTGTQRFYFIGSTAHWNGGVKGPYNSPDYSVKKTTDLWVRIE